MAKVPGKNSCIYANGYDMTGYLNQYGAGPLELRSEDKTVFKKNSIERQVVMDDSRFNFAGFYDKTVGGSLDMINGALSQTLEGQFVVTPEGDTFDDVCWVWTARTSRVSIGGAILNLVPISGEAVAAKGFEFAKILHVRTNEAVTFDGTTQDNAAGTTDGGVGFLQVFTAAGTTADVIIEQSTSGAFGGEETTLLTFTQVTSARTVERIEVTGTVDRYLRVSATLAGGAFEIFAAFHRS